MEDLSIACVKWGEKYSDDYVDRLYSMVKRHSTVPFKFLCFSEKPFEREGITHIQLNEGLYSWWNKMYLFKEGVLSGRVVYFDLDTIICANIDELLSKETDFAIMEHFYHERKYASGVMAWRAGHASHLWQLFEEKKRPNILGGDQEFIHRHMPGAELLQNSISGIYSWKKSCIDAVPADARIVCFHGEPKPHNLNTAFVRNNWR